MPRTRPPDRLDQLIASAIKVFTTRGYRRAQMADVARELGVSPGTLYNYVESKEALFHVIVERGFGSVATPPATYPVPTPPPGATLAALQRRFGKGVPLPAL